MRITDFEITIAKYLTHSISSTELDDLNMWIEEVDNDHLFNSNVQIDYLTRHVMSQYNAEKAKQKLLHKIRQDKRLFRNHQIIRFSKYAAVAILFLALGHVYQQTENAKTTVKLEKENSDQITLKLSNGSLKTISEDGSISIYDEKGYRVGLQQGNQLIYHKASNANEIRYNTLKIPYGKRFVLILSDGTKAHLNSGTSIKYPVAFIEGKQRQVFLEGEGYFDVTHDQAHPFIVNANELNVQVLGTKFNLSAYSNEKNISTVLVEGSVGFFEKDAKFDENDKKMRPGQIAVWQKHDNKIEFKETDTDIYTGWMYGKIIFNHMRFADIIKKLERNYNVSIVNTYRNLDEATFTASFDTETIAQVLEAFNKNFPMRFIIEGDNIRIEEP